MKNRRNIIATLAVAFAGILLWLYYPTSEPPKSLSKQGNTPPSKLSNSVTSAPTDTTTTFGDTNSSQTQINKEQRWKMAFLTPISVYGKVVDENGKAIPNANVEIGINNNPLPNQSGSIYVKTTDENGLFALNSHGIAFSLKAYKDGYYSTKQSMANRNVVVPARDDVPQPTEDQPIILVLHKQGQTEPLISVNTGQINIPRTGQPVNINLVTGQTGQGSLQIASWVGDYNQRQFDWRYQLSIPGGGIIERKGQFDFEAPVNGYQSTVEINMPATAENWALDGEKEYFGKLPDGRYARFSVRFYPRSRNFVVIESFVNPTTGSRNLEFDKKKALAPH